MAFTSHGKNTLEDVLTNTANTISSFFFAPRFSGGSLQVAVAAGALCLTSQAVRGETKGYIRPLQYRGLRGWSGLVWSGLGRGGGRGGGRGRGRGRPQPGLIRTVAGLAAVSILGPLGRLPHPLLSLELFLLT